MTEHKGSPVCPAAGKNEAQHTGSIRLHSQTTVEVNVSFQGMMENCGLLCCHVTLKSLVMLVYVKICNHISETQDLLIGQGFFDK